ncbi:unnamed protein product [Rotaria sp. Silwood2]|nr:unnamed protein product [Rotaria sp. Silwood2]CAF3084060.1 unnamed protein product [Rotaria sp. Silwood2]CAF3088284.1 unnamed protein product [Rotaria sp. Silwood2]CAF4157702.1 unnamed protein product [Rotaria sp. Silwood2]CAF4185290.1 unnamed protein product [Rotaria sp. Silwood2]
MTMWMFWTFICLALGQLTHSWPANDQRFRLRTVLGTAEMIDESRLSLRQQLRSMNNNDEDNDDRNFVLDFKRRGPSNEYKQQAFKLTNEARAQGRSCGDTWYPAATELTWNDKLGDAAQGHADSMLNNNYFSHTGADGSSFVDRIENAGYPRNCATAENIAGNQTPEATVAAWLKSSGHCANIMSKDSTAIGIGYAEGGRYGGYWVQNFGSC